MKRLYLLRHAKSDWSYPGLVDHDRPLNARGERAVRLVRQYIQDNNMLDADHPLDLVLCSTALRTRQTLYGTLQPILDAADSTNAGVKKPDVQFKERLYHADSYALLEEIRHIDRACDHVMLVGHNPGLHDLAAMLAQSGDAKKMVALHKKLPTGALVVLAFDDLPPKHIVSGTAQLVDFVRPSKLLPKAEHKAAKRAEAQGLKGQL